MNKMNPVYQIPVAALFVALFLPAANLMAQSGFRISAATGLELGGESASKPRSENKTKPVPAVAEKKATEITCSGETSFDAKAGMVIFIKEVQVKDPQFSLTADKLTAYLKKAVKDISNDPVKAVTEKAEAATHEKPNAKSDSPASGLERAVAEGNVFITQERVDEKTGEMTKYTGKGAKADYNALTGEMTLSGWPQIQQGLNAQVATDEGTIMIMDKEGHMRTKGPSMTVIKAEAKPPKTP